MGKSCTKWGMGKPMKYSTDGLPKKQISVLRLLEKQAASKGFYLEGGTALAIHLSHRISVDLDWFTPHVFADGKILAQSLRNASVDLEIEQVSPGTLHGSGASDISIHFLSRLSNGMK